MHHSAGRKPINIEGKIAEHIVKRSPIPLHWVMLTEHFWEIRDHLKDLGWHFNGGQFLPPAIPEGEAPGGPYGDTPIRA